MTQDPAIKRFVVFSGDNYYPRGGWSDYQSSHATLEEAKEAPVQGDWSEIVDLATGQIVQRKVHV